MREETEEAAILAEISLGFLLLELKARGEQYEEEEVPEVVTEEEEEEEEVVALNRR